MVKDRIYPGYSGHVSLVYVFLKFLIFIMRLKVKIKVEVANEILRFLQKRKKSSLAKTKQKVVGINNARTISY